MKRFEWTSFSALLLLLIAVFLPLIAEAEAYDGYTLFAPNNSRSSYLVNMNNSVVHSWTHDKSGGYSVYLLENGHILRPAQVTNMTFNGGGAEGAVQEMDWDGNLVWEFIYSNSQHHTHHDIEPLPNGHVLLVAWEMKTATQARQAGYNRNAALWPDHIIEVEPVGSNSGNIVWEWHAWDHLIQDYDATKDNYGVAGDHPELLDINMAGAGGPQGGDWMHTNGISYNPVTDQIVVSSHTLNEIYAIDHSTTTEEAAGHAGGNSGHGGDILYRWGNPSNYDAPGTEYFQVVHCSVWIPEGYPGEGNILAFNNRESMGTSIVVELVPPLDEEGHYVFVPGSAYGPSAPIWTYTASGFYSNHLGGCQRLPNGNTLIVESTSGYMFEVDDVGAVQWSYARGGEIVRALRYGTDYPGLQNLDVESSRQKLPEQIQLFQNHPNPFNSSTAIAFELPSTNHVTLCIDNIVGQRVATLMSSILSAGRHEAVWNGKDDRDIPVNSGIYFFTLQAGSYIQTRKAILLK